ncbi:MAG: hypothetical protein QF547_11735, partial [Alphaproteobacteria bacterium]|nr:hypothetical protein [Alphaproteobacteria bacterium]
RYPLYGDDAYQASRIDSFLDASLVFARDSQIYLLAMNADSVTLEIHVRAAAVWDTWMSGIERALHGMIIWSATVSRWQISILFVS